MTRMRIALAASSLLLFAAVSGWAEQVRDLYQAQVPVTDRSQQELDRAAREALAEVLVKLSGSTQVLQLPPLQAALAKARSRAQQYSYVRDPVTPGALAAQFEFDARSTSQLLGEAGAPLWTANRPTVLVWLVVDGPDGRQFVNTDSAPELSAALVREFDRRGVPIRLPLYDLTDTAAISTDQAWRLSGPALEHASSRYRLGEILAGRVTADDAGQWRGDWLHASSDERDEREFSVDSPEAFAAAGVDIVAQDLAARYAVAAGAGAAGGVLMVVSGVNSYADYAGVVAWLEDLELVQHANVEQIEGDRVSLRLLAQADATQLATLISLNDQLVAIPTTDPTLQLSYQWQN